MAYGISVPTYYGLRNVTSLRSVKPSFSQTLGRGTSTDIAMPSGSNYTNIFFHWSGLRDSDFLRWTSSTNLRVTLGDGTGTVTLYFRGM